MATEEDRNKAAIEKLEREEAKYKKEMEDAPNWSEVLKEDLPSDLHEQIDYLLEQRGAPELPTDTKDLITEAANGNHRAAAVLREALRGNYKAPPIKSSGKAHPSNKGYSNPDPGLKKTLEELREGREYAQETVDDFLRKITDPEWIPPGVSLTLFIAMLTGAQPSFMFRTLGSGMSSRAVTLYYFFREAEEWTKVNILLGMRDWFVKKGDEIKGIEDGPFERYIAPFKQAARAKDAAKAEETNDGQEQDRSDD